MMKFYLSSCAIFLLSITAVSQDLPSTSSKIKEVTVFLNGAQVHREANVNLKKGENIIKLTGLSQSTNHNSIQVEGNPDYTILSVKGQYNYAQGGQTDPYIQSKKDSLETLQFTLSVRNSHEKVYQEERQLLNANRSIKGSEGVLLVDDLEEMADFYRDRLIEVEYKLLELAEEKKEINADIQRINNEIYQLGAKANMTTSEVYVTIDAKKAGASKVNFSFQVYSAGWYPTYDLRTEDTDQDLELRYKAKVYQNTGTDWDKVGLTLSTGNPNLGGIAPELNPWYLYLYDVNLYKNKGLGTGRRYRKADNLAYGAEEAYEDGEMAFGYADASLADDVDVVQSLINTEFAIGIPTDIPSDAQEYDVEIQRENVPADYEYLVVPKLDKDAFLVANITDWRNLSLLPGESQIYFQGTFVGSSFIDPASTEDTLQLSLGRDPSIVTKRESIKEYCKTQNLGLKKKTTKAYKITIKNNKTIPVKLQLQDQIPLTNTNDIEVSVEETSGAKYDEVTGKLVWDMKLNPGESREFEIRFSAKYPKSKNISNL